LRKEILEALVTLKIVRVRQSKAFLKHAFLERLELKRLGLSESSRR
jgi:hypothetical protein